MSLSETLKHMQNTWDASEKAYATMFGGAKVPQGVYNARLSKCHLKTANASGNPYLGREFTVLDGENAGAKVYDRIMLHNETGPVFARKFIMQCGFEAPKSFSDLPAVAEDIENASLDLQIRVKHSGEFINVDVMALLTTEHEPEPETETPEDKEDLMALIGFAKSWNVPVDYGYSLEEVKGEMAAFTFEAENVSAEEEGLLKRFDLGDLITHPEPKPKKSSPSKKK